jgi:hypothetical protein
MPQSEDTTLALHPFKGLIQTLCLLLLATLFTSLCWLVWSSLAHRRLQAQLTAITALGQPITAADVPSPSIPGVSNAAPLWNTVFASLPANDTCPSSSNITFNDYPPFPLQWQQMENQSIADNAKLFELVHQASALEADWGATARSPNANFPYNASRAVANILADAVLHAHFHGNDRLATQRATDLLALARADGRVGNLIARLVSIGIQGLCTDRLLCIAPDLAIQTDPASQPRASQLAASPADIKSLIHLLLNDAADKQDLMSVIDFERTLEIQNFQTEKQSQWLLGPMIELSEARVLAALLVDRVAIAAPSQAAAAIVYQSNPMPVLGTGMATPGQPNPPPNFIPRWAGIYEDSSGWLSSYTQIEWRLTAERRCVAIALAVRLYRADHHDAWPPNLTDLVPAYLPAVPIDPFSPNQSPIGFIIRKHLNPDGSDRPLLYFDMTADPARAPLPPTPITYRTQTKGQWRDLSRWYPAGESSQ